MNNHLQILAAKILFLASISPSVAQTFEDKFFSGANPNLNKQEEQALEIYKKWSSDSQTASKPFYGSNGAINYVFGASQPSIVCAVMQVCDIALEAGEKVNSINLGDSSRWNVEPAVTGNGTNDIIHVIIKPLDVGLTTSMVIATDKRTYHMRLRSHRSEYMPYVYFTYPENSAAKWAALTQKKEEKRFKETMPNGVDINGLNFDYKISGSGSFKPLRVYSSGHQTIIEMPDSVKNSEAPTLLIIRNKENIMVNYRVVDNKYIVDTLFDKGVLIAGSGRNQKKVTITKK